MSKKRLGPEPVEPVTLGGVRYAAPHNGYDRGHAQGGGVLVAIDDATGDELWSLVVYPVQFKKNMEKDKQEVYITDLAADPKRPGTVLVTNEKGERFAVDTATRQVTRLGD